MSQSASSPLIFTNIRYRVFLRRCRYPLVDEGPSVKLGTEEEEATAINAEGVACPVLAHARLATLSMVTLDATDMKRLAEPRILRARNPFSLQSELLALRWLRGMVYDAAKQLGRFVPPQPNGNGGGDGSGKVRLAWKSCLQSTGSLSLSLSVSLPPQRAPLSRAPSPSPPSPCLTHSLCVYRARSWRCGCRHNRVWLSALSSPAHKRNPADAAASLR